MNNTIDVQVCGNQGMFPCTYKTVVLKPNIINDKNILNQGMMNMPNTKYVIKYDFLLSDAIVEKTANVISTNVSQCGNPAYATALADYNAAHEAWIEADNAYTNNPNDTTLAAKNAAYAALEAAQLVLNGTPQYYYFASGVITLKKGQYVSIPNGCVLLNNSLNGVVDFILAPNNTTVYIANAVIGNYNYKIMSGIEMPANCLIEFDGGSISDGVLVGNETILICNQEDEDVLKNVILLGDFEHNSANVRDKKDNTNGMAKIYLKRDKSFAEQVDINHGGKPNTIYVIQYDYILGEDITVPANCVLEFGGGSISNGAITLSETTVVNKTNHPIFDNVVFSGTLANNTMYMSWFAFDNTTYVGNASKINNVLSVAKNYCTIFFDFTHEIKLGPGDHPNNPAQSERIVINKPLYIIHNSEYFIKSLVHCNTGAVLDVISNDVTLDGLKIDAGLNNNHHNCIGVLGDNITIVNCELKNADWSNSDGGGKAIQSDSVNDEHTLYNAGVVTIKNCKISNCKFGIGSTCYQTYDTGFYNFTHYHIDNCIIENCDCAFSFNQPYWNISHAESFSTINNTIAVNCTGSKGLIQITTMSHLIMNNFKIYGDSELASVICGNPVNSEFDITIAQPCARLINISRIEQGLRNGNFTNNKIKVFASSAINSCFGYSDYSVDTDNDRLVTTQINDNTISIISNNNGFTYANFYIEGTSSHVNNKNILDFIFANGVFVGSEGEYVYTNNYRLYPRDKRSYNAAINILSSTYKGGTGFASDFGRPIWNNGSTYVDSNGRAASEIRGDTRPMYRSNFDFGHLFLDTTLNTFLYPVDKYTDESGNINFIWKEYDKAAPGVNRYGTFANKPAATDIYVGFKYFCTDKQTAEGATDGIEIIHKGNNVWVDALGRVVS